MTQLILVVDIDGDVDVDQAGLERLRTHLDLKKHGRLTDDWDGKFGSRVIQQGSEQFTAINLFRNSDGTWKVQVSDTRDSIPNTDELAMLRAELVQGITAAGYQATVRAKPSYGPRP
jgi:hypothetical protein